MKKLTIFTAPKPFTHEHINIIQRNAIRSWLALGDQVEVILIGDEPGMAEVAEEYQVKHYPQVEKNALGTPLVSAIFALARQHAEADILCYINADVMLTPDVFSAMMICAARWDKFLMVGQRWDLDVRSLLDFPEQWAVDLRSDVQQRGRLHPAGGSDYFLFPKTCFTQIPDFAIGRAGWDNWMFYRARRMGWPLVDASQAVMIIHQDHDYSHLPQGKPHYRLPETNENVKLGGGPRTIFNLLDADYLLTPDGIHAASMNWNKFWRELEIFPLVVLHSAGLAQFMFTLLHPRKGYGEFRQWLAERKKKTEKSA